MDDGFAAQIESWRVPMLIKMTMRCYLAVLAARLAVPRDDVRPRFDGVWVVAEGAIDANWVVYDQHGEEMSRG